MKRTLASMRQQWKKKNNELEQGYAKEGAEQLCNFLIKTDSD